MGLLTFAMYKPNEGKETELQEILKDHIPTLKDLELITDRAPATLRAKDGTIIEVFEWKSHDAVETAHKHPAIGQLWGKMGAICTFPGMEGLTEAHQPFPAFDIIG
jgi:hypothetical protein